MAKQLISTIKNLNKELALETDTREYELLSEKEESEQAEELEPQISFFPQVTPDQEAKIIKISINTNQKLIVVTQDKTMLCLKRNLAKIGQKSWIAPLSTLTTLLIALVTSDFKAAMFIGSAEWKAIFIVSSFVAFGWLIHAFKKSMYAKDVPEVIFDIVNELGGKDLS